MGDIVYQIIVQGRYPRQFYLWILQSMHQIKVNMKNEKNSNWNIFVDKS